MTARLYGAASAFGRVYGSGVISALLTLRSALDAGIRMDAPRSLELWQPGDMALSEETFTSLVDAGCPTCSRKPLLVETYVAQRLPLLAGEVFGSPSWGYKGEELVRGTYRITCTECAHELFTTGACPVCQADGGLARALDTQNDFPLPVSCSGCDGEQLLLTAYVPAEVRYEGKRAAKARTQTAPEDEGFHGFRVECRQCRSATARSAPCPLCGLERAR